MVSCDPLCILGETFLGLGRGLICRCFGVVVGQLWMNPGSKTPSVRKDTCKREMSQQFPVRNSRIEGECKVMEGHVYLL
jgi:hypothetical protein